MTSERQKREELYFVEEAARMLGEAWIIEPRESPDFLINSGDHSFGLEVAQAYIGPLGRKGSRAREGESRRERWLSGLRRDYEERVSVTLDLKFLGTPTDAAYSSIMTALIDEGFAEKPLAHRMERAVDGGKLWATKALRPTWKLLKDSVGWVSRDATILQDTIDNKAARLDEYRKACSDVRLLVVANRRLNSGKLAIDDGAAPCLCGFDVVYFLSHPIEIRAFDGAPPVPAVSRSPAEDQIDSP